MQVGEVRVLDVRVTGLQVVAELHGRVGGMVAFGAIVHLHALVFAGVENVLPDVLGTVGSKGDKPEVKGLVPIFVTDEKRKVESHEGEHKRHFHAERFAVDGHTETRPLWQTAKHICYTHVL